MSLDPYTLRLNNGTPGHIYGNSGQLFVRLSRYLIIEITFQSASITIHPKPLIIKRFLSHGLLLLLTSLSLFNDCSDSSMSLGENLILCPHLMFTSGQDITPCHLSTPGRKS